MAEKQLSFLLALLLDLTVGDFPNHLHPVAWMGAFIYRAEKYCHEHSSLGQFVFGFFLVITGGLLFSTPWILFSQWVGSLPFWLRVLLIAMILKPTFAFRGLLEAGRKVRAALANGDLGEARRLVGWHLVSRDTSALSAAEVASAAVESLAENLTDSLLAPIFYFVLFGLPAAWFYRFTNTADAMIGYHTAQYEYLGKFAARLDDLLNWLLARLAGLALVLAAGLCRLDASNAWRVMITQHNHTSSPNAGWSMAAAAGALGVRLEKKGCYRLNVDRPMPVEADIRQAELLVSLAALVGLIGIGGLSFGIVKLFA